VKTAEGRVIDVPDEGCVLRCDPDGSNLELFARGTRRGWTYLGDEADDSYRPSWTTYAYNSITS